MSASYFDIDNTDDVLTLTLNRPEVFNAFNEHSVVDLIDILQDIDTTSSLRLLILKATGPYFCAGADINWMQKMVDYSYEDNLQDALQFAKCLQLLNELPIPTIALVQGPVYGGGLGLIACCDIVIAVEQAHFCFSETRLGLAPAVISEYVIQAIGNRQARRYFLTAERFNAAQALQMGLIHDIVDADDLESSAQQLTQTLLANSSHAMAASKQMILNRPSSYELAELIASLRITPEAQTRLQQFLQKK